VALISAGARYGPAQPILDRLAGRAILRTDLNGTVRLFTDGEQIWVEAER
jgi:beta-lactamase superfamily II metal-dependent hydrolase